MKTVSNTGPLIALAKVDHLFLLKQLFGQVFIPPAVYRELLAKSGPETDALDSAFADFITITSPPPFPAEVEEATAHLGPGERQAIALAYDQKALLLIDERLGRETARRLGLSVSGTAGIIILAKRNGFISSVRSLLEEIRRRGYWLSDALLDTAASLAEEGP